MCSLPTLTFTCLTDGTLVDIDYRRFVPTGTAWVTLTGNEFVRRAAQNLDGAVLAGHTVSAAPAEDGIDSEIRPRTRGARGREEAAERGLVMGDGPSGGITGSGKNVVLYGLPGKMTAEAAGYYLKAFKLAGNSGSKDIVKLEVYVA